MMMAARPPLYPSGDQGENQAAGRAPRPKTPKQQTAHVCVFCFAPPRRLVAAATLACGSREARVCTTIRPWSCVVAFFGGLWARARARRARRGPWSLVGVRATHNNTTTHHRGRRRKPQATTTNDDHPPSPRRREALGPAAAPPAFFFLLYRLTQRHLALCVCVCARVCVFCGEIGRAHV